MSTSSESRQTSVSSGDDLRKLNRVTPAYTALARLVIEIEQHNLGDTTFWPVDEHTVRLSRSAWLSLKRRLADFRQLATQSHPSVVATFVQAFDHVGAVIDGSSRRRPLPAEIRLDIGVWAVLLHAVERYRSLPELSVAIHTEAVITDTPSNCPPCRNARKLTLDT